MFVRCNYFFFFTTWWNIHAFCLRYSSNAQTTVPNNLLFLTDLFNHNIKKRSFLFYFIITVSHLKDLQTDLDECIQREEHKFWKTWMMWFHQSHSGKRCHQNKKAPQPVVSCLKKEPNGIVDCARPRSRRNQSKHGQYCYCIQYILDILIIWPLKWRNTSLIVSSVLPMDNQTFFFFNHVKLTASNFAFTFFLHGADILSYLFSFAWLIFTLQSL